MSVLFSTPTTALTVGEINQEMNARKEALSKEATTALVQSSQCEVDNSKAAQVKECKERYLGPLAANVRALAVWLEQVANPALENSKFLNNEAKKATMEELVVTLNEIVETADDILITNKDLAVSNEADIHSQILVKEIKAHVKAKEDKLIYKNQLKSRLEQQLNFRDALAVFTERVISNLELDIKVFNDRADYYEGAIDGVTPVNVHNWVDTELELPDIEVAKEVNIEVSQPGAREIKLRLNKEEVEQIKASAMEGLRHESIN